MGSAVLGEAIKAVRDWSITKSSEQVGGAEATFGSLVFNDAEQKKRLPKQVYTALRRTVSHGEPLDAAAADAIAGAAKRPIARCCSSNRASHRSPRGSGDSFGL